MRTLSNSTDETQRQRLLPFDWVPEKVKVHGLRDAHSWPLVSWGKARGIYRGSFRVSPAAAWGFPQIELRTGNSWPSIVLDVDGANALYRIVDAVEHCEVLTPNWIVTRKASGGSHAVWNLARPVHRGASAREGPLAVLARISEFYAGKLQADAGYRGVLTHNPMSAHGPGFVTNWLYRDPYSLGQLGEVIPLGWRRPAVCKTAIGRNCDLFRALMEWAGSPENIANDCLAAAHAANQSFLIPLPDAEVAGIAKSVKRYRLKWITKGNKHYTAEQKTLWGRERQARGVANRRKLTHDRDKAIIQAVSEGRSLRDSAREFGLHPTTIMRIVNRRGGMSD